MRIDLKKHWPILLFILFLGLLYTNGFSRTGQSSDFSDYYEASRNFRIQKDLYSLDVLSEVVQDFESGKFKMEQIFEPSVFLSLKARIENVGSYIYPPTFAFLLIPFSYLEFETASAIFFTLNFISLVGSLFLIGRLLGKQRSFLFLSATLLLSLRFVENHQNNNQVGFLLLFLILLSVSSKRDWLSGLLLSLAIIIKITPAAFLFYFLYKRRYAVIAYTLVFAMVWLALPALLFPEFTWKMNQTWYNLVLEKYMKSPALRAWKNNQSLSSTLSKYFLSYSDLLNQGRFGMPFVNLTVAQVKAMALVLTLGISGPFLYRVYKGASEGFVLSGLFFFSVIFSGISWIHAFVFLLFPIGYALSQLWMDEQEDGFVWEKWKNRILSFKAASLFTLIAIFVLLMNRGTIGNTAEEALLMFSFLLYTSLIQYACTFYIDRARS
ncbi:DUF2029 domain-containing protein [Leptospira semungkisensis]|uniref:DUF2029 domain-containing protein n=1 Tax=Leptospira semungkisensis TaxID=2484985 RepID=A0A4V6QKJ6_9LEPT|nr:glycosyltransferase family 87 protein [Leptospira semungkisensis]TGK03969.1 DUF2029 domain-containing protein [Leptospira semungkisensis]